MKAVRVVEYGAQLVFNEVPTPTIARDEILVKVRSTAVNHLDVVKASGMVRQILPIDLPWIPGHEFSGVIEAIGSDVAAWGPGDAVFGTCGMGAFAEYLAVSPATIARKPSNLSFEVAASVPIASQTAWQGLFTHGHLEKGQTVLIHGGAGAVGAYAVQFASNAGATVIATASGGDEAFLTSIGASRVIDYREAQFEKVLREKVDVVFDLVGGDTQKRSFLVLKEGGHLVAATQPVSPEETARHRVSGAMMRLAPSADGLGRIAPAGRRDDTTRRRDRVRAQGRGSGLEGRRREPVARRARSGKTQVARQDRASCGLASDTAGGHSSAAPRARSSGYRQGRLTAGREGKGGVQNQWMRSRG
jgi:NADPH:quinone reductase-like Zn-dependent oxidoreductase